MFLAAVFAVEFDSHIVRSAEYAVDELKKLSDSGVYATIRLEEVLSSTVHQGIFHDTILMKLKLSCPHFLSDNETEVFEVVLLTNREDGSISIAIDSFPEIAEEAIEEYQIYQIEENKRRRQEEIRLLEMESL